MAKRLLPHEEVLRASSGNGGGKASEIFSMAVNELTKMLDQMN